jgi:hypothetical protein
MDRYPNEQPSNHRLINEPMLPTAIRLQDSKRTDAGWLTVARNRVAEGPLADVSIIVPVGSGDESWRSLLVDLGGASANWQLLLIAVDKEPGDFATIVSRSGLGCRVQWETAAAGRAEQMNLGAARSTQPFVWFLHADSRLGADALVALENSLQSQPDALHYFDLTFQDDGPLLTRWNALGARIRSRYLGLPFGDQGFCMKRDVFYALGGFDEGAPYGEDHLLVWTARRHRVPLHRVGASIATSARRYRTNGWLPVTLQHSWRTWRQAVPQACRLLWSRLTASEACR